MGYFNAFLVGAAGAILFLSAMLLLTLFAAWMYDGDPSGRGAYSFSLIITLPAAALLGLLIGLWLGLS